MQNNAMENQCTKFEYKMQILESHLDSFGHVNNAVYLQLYERARWDFITKNGYGLTEIHELKQGPVILDVHCRFKREMINREWITIQSQSENWVGKIGKIHQKMIKEDGSVASEATFTIGFMDLNLRKMVAPSELWLKAVGIQ
jgi:acyl-CoA thioester hydrolase